MANKRNTAKKGMKLHKWIALGNSPASYKAANPRKVK